MDITELQIDADWSDALENFLVGKPKQLADLMRQHPIPKHVSLVLADLVEGTLPAPPKNSHKRKLTIQDERKMKREWRACQSLLGQARADVESIATDLRLEPSEVVSLLKRFRKEDLKMLSDRYGVSTEKVRK